MEKINLEEFLKNKEKEYRNRIKQLEDKLTKKISFDEFIQLSEEELNRLLLSNGINNFDEINEHCKNYKFFNKNDSFKEIFNHINTLINDVIININSTINERNNEYQTEINVIKNQLEIIINIINYQNDTIKLDKEKFQELMISLNELDIEDDIKFIISRNICEQYVNNKQLEKTTNENQGNIIEDLSEEESNEVESFEENASTVEQEAIEEVKSQLPNINISNQRKQYIQYCNDIIKKFPDLKISIFINNEYEAYIKEFPDNLYIDLEYMCAKIGYLINRINDLKFSDEEIEGNFIELQNIVNEYENSQIIKKDLLKKIEEINSLNLDNRSYIYYKIQNKITTFEEEINKYIIIPQNSTIVNDVNDFYLIVQKDLNKDEKKIRKIKTITLFDEINGQPAIIDNLFGKEPFIEKDLQDVVNNYTCMEEVNKLIKDLFFDGKPETLNDNLTNGSKPKSKVDDIIYRSKKNPRKGYNADRDNPTSMHRIRPKKRSYVRYAEQLITIERDNPLYEQLIPIITKYYPNYDINTEKLLIYINIGAAIKKADFDLYNYCLSRYDVEGIELLSIFYEDYRKTKMNKKPKLKKILSDEDLTIFEKYVEKSKKVLKELSEKQSYFDFEEIGIGGESHEHK